MTFTDAPADARAESPVAAIPPDLASSTTSPAPTVSWTPAAHVPVGHAAGWLVGTAAVTTGLEAANRNAATVSFVPEPVVNE